MPDYTVLICLMLGASILLTIVYYQEWVYLSRKHLKYKIRLQLWDKHKTLLHLYMIDTKCTFDQRRYELFYDDLGKMLADEAKKHPAEVEEFKKELREMWDDAILGAIRKEKNV